jgi:hypothetical protein
LHRIPFLDVNGGQCAGELAVDSHGPYRFDRPSRTHRAGSRAEFSDGEVDRDNLGPAGAPSAPSWCGGLAIFASARCGTSDEQYEGEKTRLRKEHDDLLIDLNEIA